MYVPARANHATVFYLPSFCYMPSALCPDVSFWIIDVGLMIMLIGHLLKLLVEGFSIRSPSSSGSLTAV